MTGIIDRIQSAIGSDYAKIAEFTHHTFQSRMAEHGHFGRALVETVAEVCRHHPAVVGLAVGLLVDRLLVEEAHHHDAKLAAAHGAGGGAPGPATAAKPNGKSKAKAEHKPLRLTQMKPGRIAFEVFGGLLLLKMAASGARIFRHKHQSEVWFAPAAKLRLVSSTLCAWHLTKALRSKNVSALRNGAILFFGTRAIKPVLKWYRTHPPAPHVQPAPPTGGLPAPVPAPMPAPAQPAYVYTPTPAPELTLQAVNAQ
jgi:hypothetical protein